MTLLNQAKQVLEEAQAPGNLPASGNISAMKLHAGRGSYTGCTYQTSKSFIGTTLLIKDSDGDTVVEVTLAKT